MYLRIVRLWNLLGVIVLHEDTLGINGSTLAKVGGPGFRVPGIGVLLEESSAHNAEGHAGHGIQLGTELHFADEATTTGLGVQTQEGKHEVGNPGEK